MYVGNFPLLKREYQVGSTTHEKVEKDNLWCTGSWELLLLVLWQEGGFIFFWNLRYGVVQEKNEEAEN